MCWFCCICKSALPACVFDVSEYKVYLPVPSGKFSTGGFANKFLILSKVCWMMFSSKKRFPFLSQVIYWCKQFLQVWAKQTQVIHYSTKAFTLFCTYGCRSFEYCFNPSLLLVRLQNFLFVS